MNKIAEKTRQDRLSVKEEQLKKGRKLRETCKKKKK